MSKSKRTRKRHAQVLYDDDPSEGDSYFDITISQSSTGRISRKVSRSTAFVSERDEGTSDSTDPWTPGFFEKNTEAFVLDPLPDELQDFDTPVLQLDPDEETKARPKVLDSVYHCSLTDKN